MKRITAFLFMYLAASQCLAEMPLLLTATSTGFHFGIASNAFQDSPLEDLIQCAKKVGVKRLVLGPSHLPIESSDPEFESVLNKVQQSDLQVYAIGVINLNNAQSTKQAFAHAQRAGMELIVGVPKPELLDLVEQQVKATGIKFAIHIQGDLNKFYPDAESIYELIKHRDAGVGICVDVGNTLRLNQNPAQVIRSFAERVLDVRLWDCTSATFEGQATLAGYGVADIKEVLHALREIGYSGTVAVNSWSDPANPELGTAQTLGYLQGILSTFEQQTLPINTLTDQEKSEGWKLLFDGESSKGWRGINRPDFPTSGWEVADGELRIIADDGAESRNGGDILTVNKYRDFELKWDWKMLSTGGNSGVKYYVLEEISEGKHGIGIEYQILDDANHPWMQTGKMRPGGFRTVASAYELFPATNKKLMPLGKYNHSRIISRAGHVEHWLNGIKVLEFQRGSEEFRTKVAAGKLRKIPNFGEADEGHILIQDHGGRICYRNIKIREL